MSARKDCIAELVAKHGRPREDVEDMLNVMFEVAERSKADGKSFAERLDATRDRMLAKINEDAALTRLRLVQAARDQLRSRLAGSGPFSGVSRGLDRLVGKVPLPQFMDAFLGSGRDVRARSLGPENVVRRAPDWEGLVDRYGAEDPLLVAASREADALPELASINPEKSIGAAEAAAKDAVALLKDVVPQLSAAERRVFEGKLKTVTEDRMAKEQIARLGTECLAAAAL